MRRKGELIDEMLKFIKTMKSKNPESIKFIRLDNDGENLGLKSRIELEGLDINIEYTSPESPEQNGQVERSFANLWGRVRSMLDRSGTTQDLREKLWAECATKPNNIISRKDGKSPFERFYGYENKMIHNLKVFGGVGVKLSKLYGLPEKSSNKGNLCIMLGYPEDHPSDTYRVLDLKTLGVMFTRHVRWTGKTHGEYFGEGGTKNMEGTNLESSDDESIVIKHQTEK
jgi:hypothetical protein